MRDMMGSLVQTADQPTELVRSELPPVVLMIGKKRASEYIAPALFRIGSFSRVEIRAKGALSISTAVDVAELVRRNVDDASLESISLGTEELVINGISRRVSCIQIQVAKRQPTAAVVIEEDPASIAERIINITDNAKKRPTTKRKKATTTRRTRAKPST